MCSFAIAVAPNYAEVIRTALLNVGDRMVLLGLKANDGEIFPAAESQPS